MRIIWDIFYNALLSPYNTYAGCDQKYAERKGRMK